jgi:hypothetical protein
MLRSQRLFKVTHAVPPLSQARFSMSSLYTQQAFGFGEDTLPAAVSPPYGKRCRPRGLRLSSSRCRS